MYVIRLVLHAISGRLLVLYRSHRSERYEYAIYVVQDVEENQCAGCKFKETDKDVGLMCEQADLDILLEEPVVFMEELEDGRVVCNKYEAVPD